jgi:hypothetical protein
LTGPEVRTIWPWSWAAPGWQPRGAFQWSKDGFGPIIPLLERQLSFFVAYPLLIFEDEMQTWHYIPRDFTEHSYRDSVAGVRAWKVFRGFGVRGDADGDGKLDRIVAQPDGNSFSIWVSLAQKDLFSQPVEWCKVEKPVVAVRYADLNGDGKIDLILIDASGSVWAGISTGRSFGTPAQWFHLAGHTPDEIYFKDVDGDKKADAVIYDSTKSGILSVSLSDGTTFKPAADWLRLGNGNPNQLIFGDLNGDGKKDACYYDTSQTNIAGLLVCLSTATNFNPPAVWLQTTKAIPEQLQLLTVDETNRTDVLFLDTVQSSRPLLLHLKSTGTNIANAQAIWQAPGPCHPSQIHFTEVDGVFNFVYFDGRAGTISMAPLKDGNLGAFQPCRDLMLAAPIVR